jgi:hypothetical protein
MREYDNFMKPRIYKHADHWIFQPAHVPMFFYFPTWREAVEYFLDYLRAKHALADPSWDY